MTAASAFDLGAPIVPGESAAGVRLGARLADYRDALQAVDVADPRNESRWRDMPNAFEARYRLSSVELAVDVLNGKIMRVSAMKGYTGTLFGVFRVGMSVPDALALRPDLRLRGFGVLEFPGTRGVVLEADIDDADPVDLPRAFVDSISVYSEAWLTSVDGRW